MLFLERVSVLCGSLRESSCSVVSHGGVRALLL